MTRISFGRRGKLETVCLHHESGATCEIALHGAHVLSFVPAGGEEVFFLSKSSHFEAGTAIRGGIPVIFPQFADAGPLRKHGFARTSIWQLAGLGSTPDEAVFELTDTAKTLSEWPFPFECRLGVAISAKELRVSLTVFNSGTQSFSFTAALHSYFRTGALKEVTLSGLQGISCTDRGSAEQWVQRVELLEFGGFIDRTCWKTPPELTLNDQSTGRKIRLYHQHFNDTVVWNPGLEGAKSLTDLHPEEWTQMLCVEAARIGNPVVLKPGETFTGAQTISTG